MSETITTKTVSWEKRWHRSSNKIRIRQMKFLRPIRHRQRNSRRTPSWPWSPRWWPHTCLSNTTTEVKETPEQRISPCGESHFSKRRSESENRKSESKSESKSDSRHESKEKANKVKATKNQKQKVG
jgi:hypothetical protein